MALSVRRGNPILLQDHATGASPGVVLAVDEVESCILEVSDVYTNKEPLCPF